MIPEKEMIHMTELEAMQRRHSVRRFTNQMLNPVTIAQLQYEIDSCNSAQGMHIQLVTEEPEAFSGILAHYGSFSGVRNYIALVGPKQPGLEEKLGYWGEKLVIKAQMLGLNTCWVALTFSKKKAKIQIGPKEKLVCVIALGYGENQGKAHKNKPMESLYDAQEPIPLWFLRGVQAAMLAPTAVNQQKFKFIQAGAAVKPVCTGGPMSKIDLGIVKYHFEIGAGKENFTWKE